MNNYKDIINLTRPQSKHPHLGLDSRAAQFAPFAALTGYDEAVKETARFTDKRIVLDDEEKSILDNKLQIIQEQLLKRPEVTFTYFLPDLKKDGGKYVSVTGIVKKIDGYNQVIVLEDKTVIPIHEIVAISGDIFKIYVL